MNTEVKEANQAETRFVIKRNGQSVPFEAMKIRNAVLKANAEEARADKKLSETDVDEIVDVLTSLIFKFSRSLSVEEIQDLVEAEICKRSFEVFKLYHDYRFLHQQKRSMTGLDEKIAGIVEVTVTETGQVSVQNEEVKQENSNKNPTVLSVQRDYMAGEWSRYYTNKYLLPDDIKKAHEEGMQITSVNICTTAAWLTFRICCKTVPASPVLKLSPPKALPRPVLLRPKL